MKKLISACVLACCTAASAQTVVANVYCSDWSKRYDPVDRGWLVGFMSGLNTIGQKVSGWDALRDAQPQDLILWMDGYCRKNPDRTIAEGSIFLLQELTDKAASKK